MTAYSRGGWRVRVSRGGSQGTCVLQLKHHIIDSCIALGSIQMVAVVEGLRKSELAIQSRKRLHAQSRAAPRNENRQNLRSRQADRTLGNWAMLWLLHPHLLLPCFRLWVNLTLEQEAVGKYDEPRYSLKMSLVFLPIVASPAVMLSPRAMITFMSCRGE
jgi:hypothetical protein